jgi:hypothetical protein
MSFAIKVASDSRLILSDEDGYSQLLDCYRSGQMSERQMQVHLAEDSLFRSYVDVESAKLRNQRSRFEEDQFRRFEERSHG